MQTLSAGRRYETGANALAHASAADGLSTRAGVQDACKARGTTPGQQRDALGCHDAGQPGLPTHRPCVGALPAEDQTKVVWHPRVGAVGDGSATHQARSGGGPHKGFLADTRRSNRGWVCGKLQMPEDLPAHLAVRDGGDDPQRPPLTPEAARHVKSKQHNAGTACGPP
jgi:hypothetical protein